jgi:hypothetical protein
VVNTHGRNNPTISIKQEDAGNHIELPFDEEVSSPAPQEEFRQDIDNENPRADSPEPHNEILRDNPAELDQPDQQNPLRDGPGEDDLL